MHLESDGSLKAPPPIDETVKEEVVRIAIEVRLPACFGAVPKESMFAAE